MAIKKTAKREEPVSKSMSELGQEFRRVRKEKKIGLQNAADRLGLSFGYLARIERGEQKLTSEQIEGFASLYALPAKDLLEKAGLTSSFSQYLPIESIQHCATFVTKHPSIHGTIHVPSTLEGKAMTVCLFQALFGRRLLDETENTVTLEWLGFASLEDLRLNYLGPTSEITNVLRRRDSSTEALEDVTKVLRGAPHWGMQRWVPKESLPKLDRATGPVRIDEELIERSKDSMYLEVAKDLFEALSNEHLRSQVTELIREHRRQKSAMIPDPAQTSLFHMGESIEEERKGV